MIASRSFRIDFRTHGRPAATRSFRFYLAIIIISAQFHIPWVVRAPISVPNVTRHIFPRVSAIRLGTRLKPSSQYDARHLRCVGTMRRLTQCNAFLCVSLFTKFMRTHWYTCLFHVIIIVRHTDQLLRKWSVKKMTIEGFCYWLSYNIALFFSVP